MTEDIKGMVPTPDGRYGVMTDPSNGHFGWIFTMHPDGMWISSRKASAAEMAAAEHHLNSVALFNKLLGARSWLDGTGPATKLALVPDQIVGRVVDQPGQSAHAMLNSLGCALPDGASLYARPANPRKRYVRVPSRKDPKYNVLYEDIDGGPVFEGDLYCKDLFEALERDGIILAETLVKGDGGGE